MALSNKAKEVLIVAVADKKVGQELAAAIDAALAAIAAQEVKNADFESRIAALE